MKDFNSRKSRHTNSSSEIEDQIYHAATSTCPFTRHERKYTLPYRIYNDTIISSHPSDPHRQFFISLANPGAMCELHETLDTRCNHTTRSFWTFCVLNTDRNEDFAPSCPLYNSTLHIVFEQCDCQPIPPPALPPVPVTTKEKVKAWFRGSKFHNG
jgi:hypothetical protein